MIQILLLLYLDILDTYKYLIGAGILIILFLTFLVWLYCAIFNRKSQPKQQELKEIEERRDNESDAEYHSLKNIDEEVESVYNGLDVDEYQNEMNSFTSDDDILNDTGKKKAHKKRRHSLFTFSNPRLKGKHLTEKSSLIGLSVSSTDLNYSETSSVNSMDSSDRYKSRSMESIISAAGFGSELFSDTVSTCRLQINIKYDPDKWTLTIGCRQAECVLNTVEHTSYWKVHMTMLPFKKQRFKTQTRTSLTPIFNQSFTINNIAKQVLPQMSIRYRLYGRTSESGTKKMAGELIVGLGPLFDYENYEIEEWRTLFISNTELGKTKKKKKFFGTSN